MSPWRFEIRVDPDTDDQTLKGSIMHAFKLVPANQEDFEELLELRMEAMRTSLEKIGRYDPLKSRSRFAESFVPEQTRHIVHFGSRVGFVAVRPETNSWLLDHLYICPSEQRRGLGGLVLRQVFLEADAYSMPLRVGALKDSDSNRFYARHGFTLVQQAEFDNYYMRPAQPAA